MSLLVDRSDCALLVIDVQERLFPHIHGGDRMAENIVRLLRFASIVGLPVLSCEQEKLGPTIAPLRDELGGVAPIEKADFGAFGHSAFAEQVASLGRRTLVLCGIEAHICVAQTGLQALATHSVQVVADAVGSRTPENRHIGVERLRQAGAEVTSTEMFLYEVLRRAGTDEFRRVLTLVK